MDAAAIEQMNKVRAQVGLPPLPVPGQSNLPQFNNAEDASSEDEEDDLSTLEKREAAADSNWQKLEDERLDRLERQKRKEAAKKARDAAQRFAKLDGQALGEAEGSGDLDTRTWLLQQKKRQKKIEQARKLEAELAEREREMQAEYTSKDLAGVKVGHEIEEFDELTGEKILTLKDTAIGEDSEDDELENQDLKDQDKLQERLLLKKKRPDYDPTEQGETTTMLSKYDEEIDGRKQKRFKLDGQGTSTQAQQRRAEVESNSKTSRGVTINLDMLQDDDAPANDYNEAIAVKVKKSKKKKDKKSRQKAADEDDIFPISDGVASTYGDAMDIDATSASTGVVSTKKRALEFDDDDLQSKLAEQRREALKKRKKTDAAELARQMRESMAVDEEALEEGGLLIDETTEFVANLKKPDVDEEEEEELEHRRNRTPDAGQTREDGDVEMAEQSYAALENTDNDQSHAVAVTQTGLEEEENMAGYGLAASLALLRKRGILKDDNAAATAEQQRQHRKFMAEKQTLIDEFDSKARDQREAERKSGRLDRMSNREREAHAKQQNDAREQYLSRLQADMFNAQYKPDVKLTYYDEFGRSMNQKEAFKHLSHAFHGKASGKQKTEKRLKKIADEQKNMAKGVLNASEDSGMSAVQGREGKKTGKAGVRLQ